MSERVSRLERKMEMKKGEEKKNSDKKIER
jgi:hypothetical protein